MSATEVQVSAVRRACAYGLILLLLAAGVVLAALSDPPAVSFDLPLPVTFAAFVGVYYLGTRYTLDYEFRSNSMSVTLVQLPLALGVQVVMPLVHVGARAAACALTVITQRQAPLQALCNMGLVCFEVGAATFFVSLPAVSEGPAHWLALYVGLHVGDAVGAVVLGLVWRLIGIPVEVRSTVASIVAAAPVTLTFTAFAVVAVPALRDEPLTAPVLLGLMVGLAVAYRAHRRSVMQQRATEGLYAFTKDLGPLELSSEAAERALERVRLLLHAQQLELSVRDRERWSHLVVAEGEPVRRDTRDARAVPSDVAATGTAALRRGGGANGERMATPILGSAGLAGILLSLIHI